MMSFPEEQLKMHIFAARVLKLGSGECLPWLVQDWIWL